MKITRIDPPAAGAGALLQLREGEHYERDSSTAFYALLGRLVDGDLHTWRATVCVQGGRAAALEDVQRRWGKESISQDNPCVVAWNRHKFENELAGARARVAELEGKLATGHAGCSACNAEHGEWCRAGCPGWASIINGTGPAPSIEFVEMVRADLAGFLAALEAEFAANAANYQTDLFTASARWLF